MGTIKNMSELPSKFDKFYDIFDISKIGLWEMTPQGDVTFYNETFYGAFDLPQENPTLDDWIQVVDDAFKDKFNAALHQHTARQQKSFKSEYKVRDRFGKPRWIEAIGIAEYDLSGNMLNMIGSHSDITFLRMYGDKLYDLTYIEPVTGLYNRHKLNEVIQSDIDNNQSATLIFMNFYLIRHLFSLYGYEKANFIVKENVASVLNAIDPDFQTFRVSTSKFAILIKGEITPDDVGQLISKIKNCIMQVRSNQKIEIDVDFQTAVLSYPFDHMINSADEIINRAYLTLQESRLTPEGNIKFYCSETQSHVYKHIFIESTLSLAISRGEMFNVYHPIIDAKTNVLKGFEALVRWNTDEWGPIFPDEFISVAEQNGSICELGLRVFEDACNFIKKYNSLNGTEATISVNASALEMIHCDYIGKVQSVINKTKVSPKLITIEITESMMIDRSSTLIIENLEALIEMGFEVSLDDFGSGYASLNSMIYAPISEVKIDREIMQTLMEKPLIKGFIQSVIHLCKEHDVSVVTEGIENETMLKTARQMNADKIQGYYYAKPLPYDQALNYAPPEASNQED